MFVLKLGGFNTLVSDPADILLRGQLKGAQHLAIYENSIHLTDVLPRNLVDVNFRLPLSHFHGRDQTTTSTVAYELDHRIEGHNK